MGEPFIEKVTRIPHRPGQVGTADHAQAGNATGGFAEQAEHFKFEVGADVFKLFHRIEGAGFFRVFSHGGEQCVGVFTNAFGDLKQAVGMIAFVGEFVGNKPAVTGLRKFMGGHGIVGRNAFGVAHAAFDTDLNTEKFPQLLFVFIAKLVGSGVDSFVSVHDLSSLISVY